MLYSDLPSYKLDFLSTISLYSWRGHDLMRRCYDHWLATSSSEEGRARSPSSKATRSCCDVRFIESAVMSLNLGPPTTATRQGSQSKKLEEIKQAKNIDIAANREAALAAKVEAAEKKAAEAQARKARAAEKKEALAKKRKADLEAKKNATEEKKVSAVAKKKRSGSCQAVN